ncbi:hypothetical protein C1E24_04205 [Pseudoalteromonas phenolica]|uniref:BLUF domain-containing protein n=2 Tax=Pseudoalteromonas phenolica TaxID=161398 RepID=A0A5R9Q5V5_9GAMM|nr:hypothetical protein C1E24_04205 [Pseudoalteromonas phenolica]
MQALEGQENKVLERFELIKSDLRHNYSEALMQNPIDKRNFDDWAMGLTTCDEKAQLQTVTKLRGKNRKPLSCELLYVVAHNEITVEDLNKT